MKTSQEPLRWQDGVSDARLVKIGVVLFILSAFAARLLGELFLEGIVSSAASRFGSVAVMLLSLIVAIASGLPATWVVDPRRRVLELHR